MRVESILPSADATLAATLLTLQHAAYRIEADLIGDDRIPALQEDVVVLRAHPYRWLGAFDEPARLVGALAWTETAYELDICRLVVDPDLHRRGVGRRLVEAALDRAGTRTVLVSTGRDNRPARRLYERLGFGHTEDEEIIAGLWLSHVRHAGKSAG